MADLSTSYLGLSLKNPLIAASSSLTSTLENLLEFEKSGVGAVVLKSLFEEQIEADLSGMINGFDYTAHADALDLFRGAGTNYYINNYLKLVKDAKDNLSIPVIASINCVSAETWIDYAKRFQDVGADALELNVFIFPAGINQDARELEKHYLDLLAKVQDKISLPVSLKLGCHFTALGAMLNKFADAGAKGLVLFNRFYRPDIDIEKQKIVPAPAFSVQEELTISLQWIAVLSGQISCDLCAATGIHTGRDMVKQLLAGAKAVQVCTSFYKNGKKQASAMISDLESWMERHKYSSIEDFRGKLSRDQSENPEIFERTQYIKALVGIS